MAEILDVINRFTYQVEDTELVQATQQIQSQIQGLTVLAQRQVQLQQAFDRTAANEIEKRTRIANLIQRTKGSIEQTTAAIGKQVQENQKLQNAIVKEIGLINTLDARLKVLQEDRRKAFDVKDIQRYNREIEQTQKRIASLTTTSKGGSILGGLGSSVLQGVGIGTGIGLVTQGVGLLKDFIDESIKLATVAEGVTSAFERLDRPDLLSDLQNATKGTVSDLELMKNAINFNNFGLPVEKLGIALEFARLRAKDTGQEVDFLVQSIVTGIGRQSPLILDNLGINAKRVADKFKETGDFALAAFQIIQEESAKAGADLDTFGEKQARLNATIQNAQVNIGKYFQAVLGGTLTELGLLYDDVKGFFDPALAIAEVALKKAGIIQDEAEASQIKSLDDYLNDYKTADALGRQLIENQISESYQNLIRTQQRFEREGLASTADILAQQLGLYQSFFKQIQGFNGKKLDFSNFTGGDLSALNKGDLETLREEGVTAMGLLTNPKEIAKVQGRIALIDAALSRYSIAGKRTKTATKESRITTRDLIEQTPEQWAAEIDKIVAEFAKLRQPFSGTTLAGNTGVVGGQPTGGDSNVIISDRNDIQRKEKETQEAADKAKAARELRVQQEKDAFNTIADAAIQSYGIILQAQINAADAEIAIRQTRVNAAIELAKNGNDEILQLEQQRLEESIKEREKFAQRQAAINAALTISQSVLAIATAAGETGAGAIVIVPAVIAAIAAGFAAVTALSQESTAGFKDGVVDLQGEGNGRSDSIPAKLSKGESVITADATLKNKEILRAMNNGAVFSMPNMYAVNNTSHNTTLDMGGVIKELKDVKKAVANNAFKQDVFFNEHGVGTLTQKAIAQDRRRWS